MSVYITSLLDNKVYCKSNGSFKRHLIQHNLTYQQYYEEYITGVKEKCSHCGNPKTFYQSSFTYAESCGNLICVGKTISKVKSTFSDERNAEINALRSKTTQALYGVNHVTQSAEHIAKRIATNKELMTDGRTRKQHQQDKVCATKLERYGNMFYNNAAQIQASKGKRTRDQNIASNLKRSETNIKVYGVENHFLLASSKSAAGNAKIKNYILPSGLIISIQGYESRSLTLLLESYSENDLLISDAKNISTCKMPIIPYSDLERHHHKYYPDIFIPKENKIIEVKSRWWYDSNGIDKYYSRLINNERKKQACLDAGYNFEFHIYEIDKSLTIIR